MSQLKLDKFQERFEKATNKVKTRPVNKPTDVYLLASATTLLLLARAKHLFLAIIEDDRNKNAYSCYV